MATNRYRADYYLFRHFLMGMGSFRDRKVESHEAMKLIFGINQPFKIRLEKQWLTTRAALLSCKCPHFINGEGDWQIVLWIDPGTSLWNIFRERSLRDRPWTLHDVRLPLAMEEVVQTVGDTPDPQGALKIAETLIRVYSGARAVPATWDLGIKKAVGIIDNDPGSIDARSLAKNLGMDFEDLNADFHRVVGSGLENYLHRRKWTLYITHRQSGSDRNEALRLSGLPGWEGLKNRFEGQYGLDLETLESSLPFVRVYEGPGDQPVLYL
jgi:hypothetical protein